MISPLLAIPIAILGVGVISYGAYPEWCKQILARVIPNLSGYDNIGSIVIRPVNCDVGIYFDDRQIFPKEEDNHPFLFKVINTGESKIVRAKLQFEVIGVDSRDLIETNRIFEEVTINKHDEAHILTEIRGDGKSYSTIPLSNVGELTLDAIPAHSQSATEFELPKPVKAAFSVFMIADSYRKFVARENNPKMEALKQWAMNGGGFDKLQEIQDDFRYDDWHKMPDLKIKINYETTENEKVTMWVVIKSIYLLSLPPMWWPGEDGRTLKGGAGILSYENPNEPSQGHYNAWERQKGEMASK